MRGHGQDMVATLTARALPRQWWGTTPWSNTRDCSLLRATCHRGFWGPSTHSASQSLVVLTLCSQPKLLPYSCSPTLCSSSLVRPDTHPSIWCTDVHLSPFSCPLRSCMSPVLLLGDTTRVSRCRECWGGERRCWLLGQPSPTVCSWAGRTSKAGGEATSAGNMQKTQGRRCAGSLLTAHRADGKETTPPCPMLLPPLQQTEGTCSREDFTCEKARPTSRLPQ